jgi:hypothetical protein
MAKVEVVSMADEKPKDWVDFAKAKAVRFEVVLEALGLMGSLHRDGEQLQRVCPLHKVSGGKGDPIVFGPKSSNFSKSLIQNRLLTHCCLSSKGTLSGVAYRIIDCLTEFSARKIPENSGFSAAIVFVKKTLVC